MSTKYGYVPRNWLWDRTKSKLEQNNNNNPQEAQKTLDATRYRWCLGVVGPLERRKTIAERKQSVAKWSADTRCICNSICVSSNVGPSAEFEYQREIHSFTRFVLKCCLFRFCRRFFSLSLSLDSYGLCCWMLGIVYNWCSLLVVSFSSIFNFFSLFARIFFLHFLLFCCECEMWAHTITPSPKHKHKHEHSLNAIRRICRWRLATHFKPNRSDDEFSEKFNFCFCLEQTTPNPFENDLF